MSGQLRIGLIGCGHIARWHVDAIAHDPGSTRLAAVADIVPERAIALGERYGVPAYPSAEALLEDPGIDAVIVATPNSQHPSVALQAIRSGRHALVEKPFAIDPTDASRMVAAADEVGVVVMAAQSRRYIGAIQEAYRRRPEIGRIQQMAYTLTRFYNIKNAPSWYARTDETGGVAIARASHALDLCLWFCDDKRPVSVYAADASFSDDFEGTDEAALIVTFDDGAIVTNILSVNARQPRHQCYVIGSVGTMLIDHGASNVNAGERATSDASPSTDLWINGELVRSGPSDPNNFAVQVGEFAAAIREGRQPISSGRSVLPAIRLIEGARISARERRVVQLAEVAPDATATPVA